PPARPEPAPRPRSPVAAPPPRMDLTTLIGLVLGFGLLGWSLTLGEGGLLMFVDVPSVLIVGGGTLSVFLMNFPGAEARNLTGVFMRTLLFRLRPPAEAIERVVEYATLARKEGLLALESKLAELDDGFMAKGIQLVIDGFPAETVRDILDLEAEWQRQRHMNGKKMLDALGSFAPAFGMIGTLVGLIQMLSNLADPSKIGGGMATALLTTLYGAVAANMVFIPLSGKLDQRAKEEALLRELMIEGIVAIQSGDGPQLIKEKLKAFVAPSAREAVAA
ncbi:MAG TPA: MotA/TolQ/ExbB proton channel family protein, partial [Planctomycetota bacterium]|nr:MotA/TolQ/ExbB proton channel family protein [Planctomycetota bacterium]